MQSLGERLFPLDRQPKRGRIQRVRNELLTSVVSWFRSNGREFPWRETLDPFHVLIAEVLLRQTQSARVVGTYTHLVAAYPDPASLAECNVDDLRKWFKPLGLVQRADRLVECSRRLVEDYQGQVPRNLRDLQSLPGIGRYSARATLCMAFNHPLPMIDEGAGRVLRRVLGLSDTGAAYSDVRLAASWEQFRPGSHAREFNLGLIDISAAHCHSRKPDCRSCPILAVCAFGNGLHRSSRRQR
ncbi:MAG: hypothetical protein F4045_05870 [Chloroflexi bacterium]|nr:hypothetical protein [Chloroflexota bacterium]MYK34633.1 hypothetical protein [Chloroflexota bacterium]